MTNPEFQRRLRCAPAELRRRLPGSGPGAAAMRALIDRPDDGTLLAAVRNLGGHDLDTLAEVMTAIDDARPTVIFAYTVKGYGLATEGHPQNHSALLSEDQLRELGKRTGMSPDARWARFDPASPAGRLGALAAGCAATRRRPPRFRASRRTSAEPLPAHPRRRPRSAGRCWT